MKHDYQPWVGELAVQPLRCPCCGSAASVWQYVENPGDEVLRVVMCESDDFAVDALPILIDTCLLKMPPQSFYCQTARQAVAVWNLYAESLTARRAAISAAPRVPQGLQPLGLAVVDSIADDGCRNAAGGIYSTRVQEFALEVQRAFAQQNGMELAAAPLPEGGA